MSKQSAQEFSETLKKTVENLKQEVVRKGLEADKTLVEKVKKISEQCDDASKHIKERLEK